MLSSVFPNLQFDSCAAIHFCSHVERGDEPGSWHNRAMKKIWTVRSAEDFGRPMVVFTA
jgi:hypothetical protein